ncbi:MAG: hypothetical protein GF317_23385 [Candidatus Lokiarchaeota archaeon]|nr:hypothetical protein [Candidatus Lokiarchaeota archaeon]
MKKIFIILALTILSFAVCCQTDESVETTVPIWYGDRQLEPYDESETVQIILDRNDTTFIWSSSSGIYINDLLNSILGQQDLTGANNLTVNEYNQSYYITDTGTPLQLVKSDRFIDGDIRCLIVQSGQSIVHDYPASGNYKPFQLAKGGNFVATQKTALLFEAHDNNNDNVVDEWLEVAGTSIVAELERNNYTGVKNNAVGYTVTQGEIITGFSSSELTGKILTNQGTATIQINSTGDTIECTSGGTLYNLQIYDSSNETLEYYFPLSEGQRTVTSEVFETECNLVFDIQNGQKYRFENNQISSITRQSNYFAAHDSGYYKILSYDSIQQIDLVKTTYNNLLPLGFLYYYDFDGDTVDFTDFGNNGILENSGTSDPSLTTDKDGNSNRAYIFGTNNRMRIPNADYLDNIHADEFTFSAWIYINSFTAPASILMCSDDANQGWRVVIDDDLTRLEFICYYSGTNLTLRKNGLSTSTWYHILLRKTNNASKTTHDAELYIDNVLQSPDTYTQGTGTPTSGSSSTDNGLDHYIGTRSDYSWDSDAIYDEIMVFNRAITDTSIAWLYNNFLSTTSDKFFGGGETITEIQQKGSVQGNFIGDPYEVILLTQYDSEIDAATTGAYKIKNGVSYTYDEIVALAAASPAAGNTGHIEIYYSNGDPTENNIEKIEINVTDSRVKTIYTFVTP